MSTRSGRTTQRRVVDVHKGYSIIKVKVTNWYKPRYSTYYTNIPDTVEVHYDFCLVGREKCPSQLYECYAKNVEA